MPNSKQRDMYTAKRTQPFTVKELEVMCDVTQMTVYLWRKGTATKDALPSKTKGAAVRMPVRSTLAWLRRHEIPIAVHPDDLSAPRPASTPAPASSKKPGPKPRASIAYERPSAR